MIYLTYARKGCALIYRKAVSIFGYFFYKKTKTLSPEEIFGGKTVSIVGPAGALQGMSLGKEIDKADVVVKFNRMIDFEDALTSDYGAKYDIVFHGLLPGKKPGRCGKIRPLKWKKRLVKAVVYPFFLGGDSYYSFGHYFLKGGAFTNTYKISADDYKLIEMELGSRPTSGMIAMLVALSGGALKINVYGFSFFATGHAASYFGSRADVMVDARRFRHSPDNEHELARRLSMQNGHLNFIYPNPFEERNQASSGKPISAK